VDQLQTAAGGHLSVDMLGLLNAMCDTLTALDPANTVGHPDLFDVRRNCPAGQRLTSAGLAVLCYVVAEHISDMRMPFCFSRICPLFFMFSGTVFVCM
jgi:hypothetical protein